MLFWTEFFSDAGIIESDIENYAVTFVKHRIRKNMLLELNKEYLSEMGITAMGDIIAIIRHAKAVLSKVLDLQLVEFKYYIVLSCQYFVLVAVFAVC